MTNLLSVIHVVMAILASWRLVDLFAQDRITEWLRQKWPTYLWTCPRCLSVWMGAAATVLFVFIPWMNWPLALSWLYMWRIEGLLAKPHPQQMVIEINDGGAVSIPRSNIDPKIAFQAIEALVNATRVAPPLAEAP